VECGRPTGTVFVEVCLLCEYRRQSDAEVTTAELDPLVRLWDNKHVRSNCDQRAPISDLLRETIRRAIDAGETTYLALERETGITRASVMRFVRGTQFLRLDLADKLAARFGLHLAARSRRASR
jgi:hypothetical protein